LDIIAHLSILIYMCIFFQYGGGQHHKESIRCEWRGWCHGKWLQQDSFKPEIN